MAKQRFIAIIEVEDETYDGQRWEGDKYDVAAWIDHGMCSCSKHEVGAEVWDNLKDFFEDNVLETLAENG
jgi:hypothetical protein